MYHYSFNYHRYLRRLRRFRRTGLVLLVVGLVALSIVVYFFRSPGGQSSQTSTTTSKYEPATQVFATNFFRFQTDKSWRYVPKESNSNVFVYRSYDETNVEHELFIYVTDIPAEPISTRVLPVTVAGDHLMPEAISNHCRESLPPNPIARLTAVMVDKVRTMCQPDAVDYSVWLGTNGGDKTLEMPRANNVTLKLAIFYRDTRNIPNGEALLPIVTSFQVK